MGYLGEFAAIMTALTWSGTSLLFTKTSNAVGAIIVNRVRVVLALFFLVLLNWAFYGYLLPFNAGWERWLWFALSGAVGYAMGDLFLFQSFVCVGPQRTLLMMSLAPLMSAGLAWIFFGEALSGMQALGVLITLAGISWVIMQRRQDDTSQRCSSFRGILFGLGAAVGQAVGYLLSKQGLTDGFPPLAGNSIRMIAAVIVLWVLAGIQGKAGETVRSMCEKPKVFGWLAFAAFTGPVLGATLSLMALQYTQIGIASTLIALPPVFMLPVNWLVYKEPFRWGDLLGTLVAVAGVAVLFLA